MPSIGDRMIDISALSSPLRTQLKAAKSAEDVQQILAADGKVDDKEKAVLAEVEAELAQITEDGNQTLTFKDAKGAANSVAFGQGIVRDTLRAAAIQRLTSRATEGRADVLRDASDKADIRGFLTADQTLAGTKGKTRYGMQGPGATKVLMQDAILLEKFGLLTASQKQQLAEIVNKLHTVKGFTGGDGVHKMEIGTDAISQQDLGQLDAMVKDALQRLDGAELPRANVGQLNGLGGPEAGTSEQQLQTVADNFDGLNAEADAAIHDLELSYSEMGGGQGGKVASQGRSFGRIGDAVQQVDQQLRLLKDQVMPSLEKSLPELSQQLQDAIVAAKPELKGQDKATILAALNDPALAQDASIQARSDKLQAAMAMYAQLGERMSQLSDAKIKGLTRMSSLKTIVTEEKVRTSAVNAMAAKLGDATGSLQELQNQLDEIGQHAPEGHKPQKLQDYIQLAQAQAKQPYEHLKSAEAVKTRLETIRKDMITGMTGLIQTYESSGTANATATTLLKKQLATLEALKTDNPDQAIEVLSEVRQHLITELGKQVGPLISRNEYLALTGLDKKVTAYADADRALSGATDAKIETIQEQIAEAKAEKAQTIERTVNTLSKFADEKLAYGSHAQVNCSLTVGLGLGSEDFGVYAGVGVQGTARIGKEFGMGPVYRATVDLDFVAEAKLKVPHLVDIEAKYRRTLASGGVGFREMDQARNYVSSLNRSVQAEVNVAILEQALKNARDPLVGSADPAKVKRVQDALTQAQAEFTSAQTALAAAEQYKFALANDRSSFEGKVDLPAFHAEGKMQVETNVLSYASPKEGSNKVEEQNKTFQATVNHYGLKVAIQNQTLLGPDGKPAAHTKDRYGFYLVIPPKDIQKLLGKGASLSASIGKETLNQLAGQIVSTIGKIDPGAGITSAMVIALLEKQWAGATVQHAKDLHSVGEAAHGGEHGHDDHGDHKFHQEFMIGTEFIFEDHKFQYAAVEAAYEAAFKDSGRFNIPAGPIPLQGRWSVGFDAEVGVVLGKVKSNDYKAKQFMTFMRDLKPGMAKEATGADMLRQYALEPALARDPKIFEYAHGVLKDLRAKFPELGGLDDTETIKKCLEDADKYLKGTFFEEVLQYPRKAGHGSHVVG